MQKHKALASHRAWGVIGVAVLLIVASLVWRQHHFQDIRSRDQVRIGIYQNAPKIYRDANGKPAGLFVDLINGIAHAEGWKLDWVPCEWPACLEQLKKARIDLMPDVAFTPQRAREFSFPDIPVARGWSILLSRRDSTLRTIDQMQGKRIAMLEGSVQVRQVARLFARQGLQYEPRVYSTYADAFAAVRNGEADAVACNRYFADRFHAEYGLRETGIAFAPATLYFAAAKGDPRNLLPAIDQHLASWRFDQQSVYYEAMEDAMIPVQEPILPPYLQYLLIAGLAVLLLVVAWSASLRWQVKRQTAQLRKTGHRLDHLLQSSPVVIYQLSMVDGRARTLWISDNVRRIFGFDPDEFVRRDQWYRFLHDEDREAVLNNLSVLAERKHLAQEYRVLDAAGRVRFVRDEMQFVPGTGGQKDEIVGSWNDLTESREQAARLSFLTHYDALTRLPNRALLQERLTHAIYRARQEMRSLVLLYMDIDRFKTINDGFGHRVGDTVLRAVADRLVQLIDAGDVLARIGGDGFVLLMEDEQGRQAASELAHRIMKRFVEPIRIGDQDVVITFSMGIGLFPTDAEDAESLLQHAEAALFDAKQSGRNTVRLYSPALKADLAERLTLERALHGAVARGELRLHYQPQLNLATGQLVGVEALARWEHPQLGMVSPGRFIPLAEEMGIIGELGAWVLEEACRQLVSWQKAGWEIPCVAVNLSVQQIDAETLIPLIRRTLGNSGLDPACLELEVTESMIMREPEKSTEALHALRAMGIKIAIDDFGSGYSSLNYIKHLPIDRLKIDQSFVRDIGVDTNSKAISRAIIGLARTLELDVVAEGIEEEQQLRFLRDEGCPVGQGYLFSKPLTAVDLERDWRRK